MQNLLYLCTSVLNLILSVFRTLQQNLKLSLYRGTSHFMAEGVLLCYARPFAVDIVDADALTTLRVLEPAPARHSKSKLFLCSRLLAAFTFHSRGRLSLFRKEGRATTLRREFDNHNTDTACNVFPRFVGGRTPPLR